MGAGGSWPYARRAILWWRARPGSAAKALGAGVRETRPLTEADRLRVAVLQTQAGLYSSARDFAREMERWVREAHSRGAGLIVFPGDTGTQLLGLLPGAARSLASGTTGSGTEPNASIRFASRFLERVYTKIFSELARRYGVFIVGGSIRREADDGRLVHLAYVFDATGAIAGRQERIHVMPAGEDRGLSPGRALVIVNGPGFRLATAIGRDADYFETFRLALAGGADLVAVPAAEPGEYRPWFARRGVWSRVQETPIYGLASHLVGNFLGQQLSGRSGVHAPLELSPGGDGILAQANQTEREELVMADLDLGALRLWRAQNQRIPAGMVLAYLPGLYRLEREIPRGQEDQPQQQWEEDLAQEQDQESPPPSESQAEQQSEMVQEEAPRIEQEYDQAESFLRDEETQEAKEVGSLGGPGDEQEQAEGSPPPEEADEDGEDERIEGPFQEDDEGGQQRKDEV